MPDADAVRVRLTRGQAEALAAALDVALRAPEKSAHRGQWETLRRALAGIAHPAS